MNKELAKFIRAIKNLNQEEFGEKIGYSKCYVGYIEQGNRPITKKYEKAIMKAFNYTEEDLIIIKEIAKI